MSVQLFSGAGTLFGWLLSIIGVFLRVRPVITITTITTAAVTQVVNLAAFFLPLKVILLAGSPGIPRYFEAFITQENRTEWLIGLTIAAVGAWLLGLLLQDLVGRLSTIGGRTVLEGANEIASARKFQNDARDFYGKFCQIAADLLFGLIVLVLLALISMPVLLTVIGLGLALFVIAAAVVMVGNPVHPGRLQRFIVDNYGEFIQIGGSVVFLGAFFVLLYPFLVGAPANVLLSILCVLLLRQGLRFSGNSIRDLISLFASRHIVEPLIFRNRQSERVEDPSQQNLRKLFPKTKRDELARERLLVEFDPGCRFDSQWEDSSVPGVFCVRIVVSGEGERARCLQQQIYAEKQSRLLEHEEVLFRYVSRKALLAPAVRARFQHGTFECQVCDYGEGIHVNGKSWPTLERQIYQRLWSVDLPKDLVNGFRTSQQMLPQRLSSAALERLRVAVDSGSEYDLLARFQRRLPDLTAVLERAPECVVNPHLNAANVVVDGEGVRIMNWSRWHIEPIGTQLPDRIDDGELESLLHAAARERRLDFGTVNLALIRLVNACAVLDHRIARLQYKAALRQIESMFDRELFDAF